MAEDEIEICKVAKISKLVDDPCFGEKYDETHQCTNCWIKKACNTRWKNRK